jgi:transcriptional regulator with XRE-family HTH domain
MAAVSMSEQVTMSQSHHLIAALKKALKANGLTYRDVAAGLKLSEASVKRLFSEQCFSLDRLEQVCQLMGLEIADLVAMMEADRRQLSELTEAQEQQLVNDPRLLVVAYSVVNGWRFDDIVRDYQLSEPEVIHCLATLDKLKLIELLPGNRIRLLISPRFTWRRHGPIERQFFRQIQEDFLRSRFARTDESFSFCSGVLSPASVEQMVQRIEQTTRHFNELNQADRGLPPAVRTGYSMVVAIRPWRAAIFEQLRKADADKTKSGGSTRT